MITSLNGTSQMAPVVDSWTGTNGHGEVEPPPRSVIEDIDRKVAVVSVQEVLKIFTFEDVRDLTLQEIVDLIAF